MMTGWQSADTDSPDEYDLMQSRRGRRIWMAMMAIGLAVVVASIAFSAVISPMSATDVPNHDRLFTLTLMTGSALLAAGALALIVNRPSRRGESLRKERSLFGISIIATLVICGFILNPLLSPIAFLHDSDLDGVQDYSDDYPNDHSRIDYPWVYFNMYIHVTYTDDEWTARIGKGGNSCWLDATAVKMLRSDNSTGLEEKLLSQLNGNTPVQGVRYINGASIDRLDEGDYFVIDRHEYNNGSRMILMGAADVGWQILTQSSLGIRDAY